MFDWPTNKLIRLISVPCAAAFMKGMTGTFGVKSTAQLTSASQLWHIAEFPGKPVHLSLWRIGGVIQEVDENYDSSSYDLKYTISTVRLYCFYFKSSQADTVSKSQSQSVGFVYSTKWRSEMMKQNFFEHLTVKSTLYTHSTCLWGPNFGPFRSTTSPSEYIGTL